MNSFRVLAAAVGFLACTALCLPGEAATGMDPAPVRQRVLDIISFTRWPAPRGELRLCVVGQPVFAAAFVDQPMQVGAAAVRAERRSAGDPMLGASCDALYLGHMAAGEQGAVTRSIAGHPVLTIGEHDPACIETTMFCLNVEGPEPSFDTNLDAIARSGVRLNPRVLLLGRRPPRTP